MPAVCYLISDDSEDLGFIKKIAETNLLTLNVVKDLVKFRRELVTEPQCVVIWNTDACLEINKSKAVIQREISALLREFLPARRIFLLSDTELSENPVLAESVSFGHYWMRRYTPSTSHLLQTIVAAIFHQRPLELATYLPEGIPVKRIEITHSSERQAVVQAISNVIAAKGFPDRIVNTISYATDELLMNAIYDAPRKDGISFRVNVDRNEAFPLVARDRPTLDLVVTDQFGVICVTDHYGSLERDKIQRFIRKDYSKMEYEATTRVGAGLGVYGVLQAGLSLFYTVEPSKKTQAILFFPTVSSVKDFRQSFRFFGFMFKS